MLPCEDGLSPVPQGARRSQTPIIMLTARCEDVDRILGLEMCSDVIWPSRSTRSNCWPHQRVHGSGMRRPASAAPPRARPRCISGLAYRSAARELLAIPPRAGGHIPAPNVDGLRTFCERPGRVLSPTAFSTSPMAQYALPVRAQHRLCWSAGSGARSTPIR